MHLTKLHHGIYCLDVEYIQPELAALYLMVEKDRVAIIETGTALSMPLTLKAIAELGLSAADVDYVIPTHIHLDHAGGAGALMQACENATLIIHPRGAAHMIDPARLIEGTIAVYGQQRFEQLYGDIVPVPEARVVIAEDDFELDFNGRTLRFIDTPGHALHHFCVVDARSLGVFTGDTFGIAYSRLSTPNGPFVFATTTPTQFDPAALNASIDRILESEPKSVYLTHFSEVTVTARLVKQLKQSVSDQAELATRLLNQPEDREEKLQQALLAYFVEQIRADGGENTEAYYQQQLKSDAHLNAQGLNVWLLRQEKAR